MVIDGGGVIIKWLKIKNIPIVFFSNNVYNSQLLTFISLSDKYMKLLKATIIIILFMISHNSFSQEDSRSYKVKKGDSLSAISKKEYGTADKWPQIYLSNCQKINNPDLIEKGDEIIISKNNKQYLMVPVQKLIESGKTGKNYVLTYNLDSSSCKQLEKMILKEEVDPKNSQANYTKIQQLVKKNKELTKKNKKLRKRASKELTEFYVAVGAENFSIDKVGDTEIESTPTSVGLSFGFFKPIGLFENAYLNPYVSIFKGASYKIKGADDNFWEDASVMSIGINLEKRFMIKRNIYIGPFIGFKYRTMNTAMSEQAKSQNYQWKIESTSIPVGVNFGYNFNNSYGSFLQLSYDSTSLSKQREVGNSKAGNSETSSGLNYLLGFKFRF